MGVIHLGDRHLIGIAFHNPFGQVVVVSAPATEQPIPIEGTALVIEGHSVDRYDLTFRNASDDDCVETSLDIFGKRNTDRLAFEGDGVLGTELLDTCGNGILVGAGHDDGDTALDIDAKGHGSLSVDSTVALREETGIVGLHGIVLGIIAREVDDDAVRRRIRRPATNVEHVVRTSNGNHSGKTILLVLDDRVVGPSGLLLARSETGRVKQIDVIVIVRIMDAGEPIFVEKQVLLGDGHAVVDVSGLADMEDKVILLVVDHAPDVELVRIEVALQDLDRAGGTPHIGFLIGTLAQGSQRSRIRVGNLQLGLSIRRRLVGNHIGHRITFGKLEFRGIDREGKRSLVAAGREVRGGACGRGDEAGLVGNGDGRRGGRSGLDTEDVDADSFCRLVDGDRRRLVRREIILRTTRLGTGLISGLFRAGEKSRHGGERHENVCYSFHILCIELE